MLAAVWLVGCPPSLTCEDLGCDPGFVCNESTGTCQPAESDCSVSGCPPDTSCNPSTGQCEPIEQRCPADPCPESEVCNTETGTCSERDACRPGDCTSPAERCNETTGRCIPVECSSDPECPSGFICGDDDTCRSGCRPNSPVCPEGQYCRASGADKRIGQCIPECEDDQDCPFGRRCEPRGEQSVCRPEPPCDADADCRSDEVCLNGQCARPPCRGDGDCSGTAVCDLSTGRCVGGNCQDDVFSPNHGRESAASIGFNAYQQLRICPGRNDWFRLPVRSGQPIRVRLAHDSERDADIRIYDDAGRLIGINQQAPAPDAGPRTINIIDFSAQSDGTAWIRVEPADVEPDEATPLLYDLSIQTDPSDVCRDDQDEENDRPRTATPIGTSPGAPNSLSLNICGADDDWFVLQNLDKDMGLEVAIEEAESESGLVMNVLGPEGTRLSTSLGNSLDIQRLGATGDWYIQVTSPVGRSSPYRLQTEATGSWECPRAGLDVTPSRAFSLPEDSSRSLWLCPRGDGWETDWLELEPPNQRARLTATISPPATPEHLDVALYRADPDTPGVNLMRRGVFDGEDVVVSARVPPTTLYLRVRSHSDLGTITDAGPYDVFYDYQIN